jgi:hypothetical protein
MTTRTRKIETHGCKVRRERIFKALNDTDSIWKAENHPELIDSTSWVRKIRKESESRVPKANNTLKKKRTRNRTQPN